MNKKQYVFSVFSSFFFFFLLFSMFFFVSNRNDL